MPESDIVENKDCIKQGLTEVKIVEGKDLDDVEEVNDSNKFFSTEHPGKAGEKAIFEEASHEILVVKKEPEKKDLTQKKLVKMVPEVLVRL